MNKKRLIGVGIVIIISLSIIISGENLNINKSAYITDENDNIIAEITDDGLTDSFDSDYASYINIVYQEAISIITKKENISENEAVKKIIDEKMVIKTALNQEVFEGMMKACKNNDVMKSYNFAAALSDTQGHLLACFSHSINAEYINYVIYRTYAGSTLKPLSVYGPAIEEGLITWSSLYMDNEYTQIENEDGSLRNWPENSIPYTNKNQTIDFAVTNSLNTTAVKVLKEYGVEKSLHFMSEMFNMDLDAEYKKLQKTGEDSILSNLALGYIDHGVTVFDILSYYQVFANGGSYTPLHTILRIEANGKNYYTEQYEKKTAFSTETSYIVNRLLKNVIENGTAYEAKIDNLDICGKTGTSINQDNWFVGMTPEYVGAIWYEDDNTAVTSIKRKAAYLFKEIFLNLNHDTSKTYPSSENIKEEWYCDLTGLIANQNCVSKHKGYYNMKNFPDICDCK